MTDHDSPVPDRELTPIRRDAIRAHLVREVSKQAMRSRSGRGSKWRVPAVALAALAVLATPALALSGQLNGLFDLGSYGQARADGTQASVADLSKATKLVSVARTGGGEIAIWTAPTTNGGQCTFVQTSDTVSAASPSAIDGSSECSDQPLDHKWGSPGQPISTGLGWSRAPGGNGRFDVVLEGRIDPASGISRMVVNSSDGSTAVALASNHFVAGLPQVEAAGQLPSGGPWILTAYNGKGATVATVDLQQVVSQARPK
jgi:hypothetical protein